MRIFLIMLLAAITIFPINAPTRYGSSTNWKGVQLKNSYVYEADVRVPLVLGKTGMGDVISGSSLTSGYDIVVTDVDGNKVDREIVSFDKSDSTFQLHFNDPAISSLSGGTQLYLQWGGDSVANDVALWTNCHNSTDDYSLVFHTEEASGNFVDWTGTSNTGLATSMSYAQTGQVELATEFGGVNNYITVNDNSTIRYQADQSITVMLWVKADDVSSTRVLCGKWGTQNEWLIYQTANNINLGANNDAAIITKSFTDIASYHHIAGCFNLSKNFSLIIDGTDVSTGTTSGPFVSVYNNLFFGVQTGLTLDFDGKQDEMKIFKGCLDSNQIHTQYDNQNLFNSNGSFIISESSTSFKKVSTIFKSPIYKNDTYKNLIFKNGIFK
jgi:hypothetical protein